MPAGSSSSGMHCRIPDQHHRHRLGEVQGPGRGPDELGDVPQILVEVGGGAFGPAGEQGAGMGQDDGVVVHVYDPAFARHRLRHLVGVVGGGDPGADVEELPHAGLADQIPHGPGQERPVPPHPFRHMRGRPHRRPRGDLVRGEVGLAAQPVVIDAGHVRDADIDVRRRAFPVSGHRPGPSHWSLTSLPSRAVRHGPSAPRDSLPTGLNGRPRDGHTRLVRGHSGGTGAADSGLRACSVSSTCWPYLASLLSPTPLTVPSSARVAGQRAATSRSVASWKIT